MEQSKNIRSGFNWVARYPLEDMSVRDDFFCKAVIDLFSDRKVFVGVLSRGYKQGGAGRVEIISKLINHLSAEQIRKISGAEDMTPLRIVNVPRGKSYSSGICEMMSDVEEKEKYCVIYDSDLKEDLEKVAKELTCAVLVM